MKRSELKQRMAALLIVTMSLGGMATPVLAEPVQEQVQVQEIGTEGITQGENISLDGTQVTPYYANGNSARIYEKDGITVMEVEGSAPVALVKASGSEAKGVAVYAGHQNGNGANDAAKQAVLTMESGKVDYLLGSSASIDGEGYSVTESIINVTGGTVRDVMANRPVNYKGFSDCGEYLVEKCTINLSGGTVTGQLGGTFAYCQVNELIVNVTGGAVHNNNNSARLMIGGTNGHVQNATLSMTGGTVDHISTGMRALVDTADISVTKGQVNELFAGSYYPDEETSADSNGWYNKPEKWGFGGVDYGIVKDMTITISGDAKYKGIYGGFQHGIKASSSDAQESEFELFKKIYGETSKQNEKNILDAYKPVGTETTVINYSMDPSEPEQYKYTKNLLEDKADGVTVNNYTGAELTVKDAPSNMKLGARKEGLTATVVGVASASDAEYAWESSDENVIFLDATNGDAVTLTANSPGTAAVTVDYNGILKTSFNVTVEEPTLKLSLPSTMDYADEDVYLIAKVENVADDLDVTYTASVDEVGLSVEVTDDDGKFLMVPEHGLSNDYQISVTAEIPSLGYETTHVATLTVREPKFILKTIEGDSKFLDVKDAGAAKIEVVSDYDGYEIYEWSLGGDAVDLETWPDVPTKGKVTAVKEGPATVWVEAVREAKTVEGPSGNVELPELKAEAEIKFTVADTRAFKADKSYIELDINPAAEKLTETVKITNDYEEDPIVEVVDNTQPVTADLENGILTVSTTAKETGSATVVLTLESGTEIRIPVVIKTTAIVAEVTGGIEVKVEDDAVAPAEVKTEGLKPEQAAEAQAQAAAKTTAITTAITDSFNKVTSDAKVAEALAANATGMSEVAMKYTTDNGLKVENGDIVKVYPKQELKKVDLDSQVVVNEETGEVTNVITIKKMTFDISLMLNKLNDKNEPVASGTLNVPKTNKEPITFSVPLPSEGIAPEARYVKVTHAGKVRYSGIQEDNGVKYTVISTYHFSPFELEFVENLPEEPHRNSRSGGSSYGTGQWIQNETGWQYKTGSGVRLVNCWKQLLWNNQMQWYHFDAAGYMTAGWFTDMDQNRYFLHNISDGNQGHMYTGWKQIEGKWYYFRANVGGPQGSLLVNGMTPDGHPTDLNGVGATYKPQ